MRTFSEICDHCIKAAHGYERVGRRLGYFLLNQREIEVLPIEIHDPKMELRIFGIPLKFVDDGIDAASVDYTPKLSAEKHRDW